MIDTAKKASQEEEEVEEEVSLSQYVCCGDD